jgi:hypothetical protein
MEKAASVGTSLLVGKRWGSRVLGGRTGSSKNAAGIAGQVKFHGSHRTPLLSSTALLSQ